MENLRNAVVVITGASSGIGRATAEAFAAEGVRLVLAARRPEALEIVAEACRKRGAPAVTTVPTDVTDEGQVRRLAQIAEETHGGVDIWVNNAGVGVYGRFVDGRMDLQRRVIETNLVGSMNGAAAILPHFLRRRRGILIHTVSMGGWAPIPFAAAYTASKFGLRGFAAALRQELTDTPAIHVCGVFPAMIDTPGFEHGANVSGHELQPGRIIHPPEDVADAIVDLARHPRPEVAVGLEARLGQWAYGVAPSLSEALGGRFLGAYTRSSPPAPATDGNLLAPVPQGRTASGGHLARLRERKAGEPPALLLSVLGLAGAALIAAAHASRRTRPPVAVNARTAATRRR